jgi:hypothetical protein
MRRPFVRNVEHPDAIAATSCNASGVLTPVAGTQLGRCSQLIARDLHGANPAASRQQRFVAIGQHTVACLDGVQWL